ncbi:MAG TPA: hypothetical protein VFP22_08340 [Candidatus Limnocylindrales bacterium]|nr:hypothetical protein [Candidatus Limnocylindrales bacterium]
MPRRLRRPSRPRHLRLLIPLAALWLGTILAPSAAAAGTYTQDLYFAGSYEHQVDSRTCTAASTAMIENLIARRDLNLPQVTILRYEQTRDALNDATQRGSDPLGWARAATYFSRYTPHPTAFAWEAYPTALTALKRAATQIAVTGRPVGLVVMHGQHAVVMTGFIATADPRLGAFTLQYIYVSDPNGYAHYRYAAGSTPLTTYLQTDATSTYDTAWYGDYVIVAPQG